MTRAFSLLYRPEVIRIGSAFPLLAYLLDMQDQDGRATWSIAVTAEELGVTPQTLRRWWLMLRDLPDRGWDVEVGRGRAGLTIVFHPDWRPEYRSPAVDIPPSGGPNIDRPQSISAHDAPAVVPNIDRPQSIFPDRAQNIDRGQSISHENIDQEIDRPQSIFPNIDQKYDRGQSILQNDEYHDHDHDHALRDHDLMEDPWTGAHAPASTADAVVLPRPVIPFPADRSAPAGPRRTAAPRSKADPNQQHPACRTLVRHWNGRRKPNAVQAELIAQSIDAGDADAMDRWDATVWNWMARGWGAGNVAGMIARYRKHDDRPQRDGTAEDRDPTPASSWTARPARQARVDLPALVTPDWTAGLTPEQIEEIRAAVEDECGPDDTLLPAPERRYAAAV